MKFIKISFIFAAGVNSAPTWLDNLIGYEETPDNKYNGYEQAPYTVIKNTTDYEVRQYPELKYVCTDSVTYPYSPSQSANSVDASWDFFRYFEFVASQRAEKSEQSKNFWKLFRYIQGENKKEQKIEMTELPQWRVVLPVLEHGEQALVDADVLLLRLDHPHA